MPITRHPWILAIWAAMLPVAPAAALDDDGLALLDLADLEHPDVGGEAGGAVDGEVGLLVDIGRRTDGRGEPVVLQGDVALPAR